jgi:CRP-like cAMP-binding protein
MIEPLIRYMLVRDDLSTEEIDLLRSMQINPKQVRKGQEMVEAHSWPKSSCLLLRGIAGREMQRSDGKRQISALHFAGDLVDAHAFVQKQIDHAIVAMSDCVVGYIPHTEIRRVIDASPHLMRMFWLGTAIDGAIERAWISCMGRSPAAEHLAHFVCETYLRMKVAGLADNCRMSLDLTQSQIADCTGMSTVHINRSLQEIRGTELLTWEQKDIVIKDWDGLVRFAHFEGTYLNLVKVPR